MPAVQPSQYVVSPGAVYPYQTQNGMTEMIQSIMPLFIMMMLMMMLVPMMKSMSSAMA
jgi:hypothetical protein